MAQFQRLYSPEQVSAAVSVVLDHGYKPEAACDAAAAGRLPGRYSEIPAFSMNVHTLKSYVVTERRRRRQAEVAGMAPGLALDRAAGELVSILDRELERIRGLQAKGKMRATDVREVAAAAREVGKLVRELPPRVAGPDGPDTGKGAGKGKTQPEVGEPGDFIGALVGEPGANGSGHPET